MISLVASTQMSTCPFIRRNMVFNSPPLRVTASFKPPANKMIARASMNGGESESLNAQALDLLSEDLSAAGHAMKVEELQKRADAAIEEAELMDEQAQVIEAEAIRIKKDVEQRIAEETDEARKRIYQRMIAVAELDATEQRTYANAIRDIADKAVEDLNMAQASTEAEDADA